MTPTRAFEIEALPFLLKKKLKKGGEKNWDNPGKLINLNEIRVHL